MKRKIIGILVVTLMIGTAFSVVGMPESDKTTENSRMHWVNCERMTSVFKDGNDDGLDQEQTSDCNYGYFCYSGRWLAQEFKPSLPILTRVQLKFFRHGNPSNDIEIMVSVREGLSENDLTSSSVKGSDIYGNSNMWIEFDFPDIEVTPEKNYYIVSRSLDANRDNCFAWYIGKDEQYPRGHPLESRDSGINWKDLVNSDHNYEDIDFCFKTYGRGNNPYKPETPTGPEEGEVGIEYTYYTSTTDPLNKQVFYMWGWGDGNYSEWFGPYSSGTTVSSAHFWSVEGVYSIKVKAKNVDDKESEWSLPLIVGIPVKNDGEDQTQETCDGHAYGIYTGGAYAQSFVPAQTTLTTVQLYVNKKGNPDKLTISIRKNLDEKDLTSIEKSAGAFPDNKGQWIKFDFPDIEVEAGSKYYIVWTPGDISDEDNIFYWLFGENNRYPSGCAWEGFPWEEFNPFQYEEIDFCFKTYHAKDKAISTPFLQFLENHPYMFPLLRQLLRLEA